MTESTEPRAKAEVQASLDAAGGNAVVYSDSAWAVARKASDGSDRWFPDSGAHRSIYLNSWEMVVWVSDWTVLRAGEGI